MNIGTTPRRLVFPSQTLYIGHFIKIFLFYFFSVLWRRKLYVESCLQERRPDWYLPGWNWAEKCRNWNSRNSQETVSVYVRAGTGTVVTVSIHVRAGAGTVRTLRRLFMSIWGQEPGKLELSVCMSVSCEGRNWNLLNFQETFDYHVRAGTGMIGNVKRLSVSMQRKDF